jgi:hypothetical protein
VRTKRFTVLASGDHHWDEDRRFDECRRVHAFTVDLAREREVDLFLSGGDVYERASTPTEREAVAEWLTAMADVCPVVISKGNHDRRLDCALLARLRTKHPILVEEAAGVHYVAGAAIAAMAWPERSVLLAAGGSQASADALARDALQAVLRGLGDELAQHDGPRILLGHFMVDGSVVSTGQPLLGMPMNVGLADLALAGAHLGVMAHIHKAQCFDVAGAPHYYTGSPFRTDFGQLEPKTVLLATFEGAELVEVEEIPTPATAMAHVEATWKPDAGRFMWGGDDVTKREARGAEVRFRYHVATDQREAAARAAAEFESELLSLGAASVKIERIIITEKRAREPEVSRATSARDKLVAHWESIGFDPGERRSSLLEKADQVEGEVRDAA